MIPDNDYVLRSDALEIAAEWCPDDDGSVGKTGDLRDMLDEMEAIPAADVEPVRHGRWVKMVRMMPPEFTGHYSCSECDWFCKKQSVRETDFDFCPGCGAKMDKDGQGGKP